MQSAGVTAPACLAGMALVTLVDGKDGPAATDGAGRQWRMAVLNRRCAPRAALLAVGGG